MTNEANVFQLENDIRHTGSTDGSAYVAWDYHGGWLFTCPKCERFSEQAIWTSDGARFHSVPLDLAGKEAIEINTPPIELTDNERSALRRIVWQLEIGEPMAQNGTCVIQSLAKALDGTVEQVMETFIQAFRDPQRIDHVRETLAESGVTTNEYGPDGFSYRENRRLVTLDRTDGSKSGHMILVYENDEGIFDSSGVFKKPSDLMWSRTWGYNISQVLVIEKPQSLGRVSVEQG